MLLDDIYSSNPFPQAVLSKFMENGLYLIMVAFFLYFGVTYLNKWRNKENFEVKRKLNLGYFFFFIALGIGVGIFTIDRIWQFLNNGNRLLLTAGYSAINRDYILFTLIGLDAGFVFLTYVVEKYILSRKVVLSWVCLAGLVLAIILRPLENYLVLSGNGDIAGYIGYLLYVVMALVLILLFVIYGKIAGSAPRGSDLANRSIAVIIGLLIIIAMLLGISNVFSDIGWNQGLAVLEEEFFFGVHMIGPGATIIGIFILNYGFSEKK
ncbi:MAG: hypothetical protein ACFFCS_06760 [Candidatus Hodarchaeota archaeon]